MTSHSHAIFKNPAPHRARSNGHEFEAHWTTVDKDLSKMEKYTLIHGLSMNFFFGFNDAQFVRKLVQAVRVFQTSSPGLVSAARMLQLVPVIARAMLNSLLMLIH